MVETSKWQQMAFWINAYNIITLRSVIDAYPVKSIKDIDGVWDKREWIVSGVRVTLNKIEHDILRKMFDEPRIHFAINCASVGCPSLLNQPYLVDSLHSQLVNSSRRFANSTAHNRIDVERRVAEISAIFDWFGEDFVPTYYYTGDTTGLSPKKYAALNFLGGHQERRMGVVSFDVRMEVRYLDYDWSLNDVE